MVYLTISTGVGGGVVVDGELYRGAERQRRRARPRHGRLARPPLPRLRPARLPRGVRLGHVDRRARRRGGPAGARPPRTSPRRARAGDPGARALWDETVEALACGLDVDRRTSSSRSSSSSAAASSRTGEQLLGPVRERGRERGDAPGRHAVDIVARRARRPGRRRRRGRDRATSASLPEADVRGGTRRAPRRRWRGCEELLPARRRRRAALIARLRAAAAASTRSGTAAAPPTPLHFAEELVGALQARAPAARRRSRSRPTRRRSRASRTTTPSTRCSRGRCAAFVRAGDIVDRLLDERPLAERRPRPRGGARAGRRHGAVRRRRRRARGRRTPTIALVVPSELDGARAGDARPAAAPRSSSRSTRGPPIVTQRRCT